MGKITQILFILIVSLLLIYCANESDNTKVIMSPFTSAIINGNYPVFKKLLDSEVDVNKVYDSEGLYPIMDAAGGNAFYIPDSDRIKLGEYNSSQENNLIVEDLLEAGANPNLQDRNGFTPVYSAIYHNRIGTVWLLLKYGADINVRDKNKWSPLGFAAYHCRYNIVRLLLDYGADSNYGNETKTPKELAEQKEKRERKVEECEKTVKLLDTVTLEK